MSKHQMETVLGDKKTDINKARPRSSQDGRFRQDWGTSRRRTIGISYISPNPTSPFGGFPQECAASQPASPFSQGGDDPACEIASFDYSRPSNAGSRRSGSCYTVLIRGLAPLVREFLASLAIDYLDCFGNGSRCLSRSLVLTMCRRPVSGLCRLSPSGKATKLARLSLSLLI